MVYLGQGNAQQIFKAFGQEWVVRKNDNLTNIIDLDFPRTRFIGTEAQADHFINAWKTLGQVPYYVRGNMSAANLFLLLGEPYKPFSKPDDAYGIYEKNYVLNDFAYVSDNNELCGLMLMYRKDQPEQWMLGLMKNSNLEPENRTIVLLSSFDLAPYTNAASQDILLSKADRFDNPLFNQIDSPFIYEQLKSIFKFDADEVDMNCHGMEKLSRVINVNKPEGLYLQPSLVCELAIKYNLFLSQNTINDLSAIDFGLEREFENIEFGDDERFTKNLLQMIVVFYEERILEQNRALINDHEFIKTMGALMWDPLQIKIMPTLQAKLYSLDLMQLILSKDAYYRSFYSLIQLGLTQDVPTLFQHPDKLSQLVYINGLADEQCRKLCLIFWVKGKLSLTELKEIVKATEQYPMLAETLVTLDQTDDLAKKILSIKELKKHALNPLIHMRKSILHRHLPQFETYGLPKADLTKLNLEELDELNRSFNVLKQTGVISPDAYRLILKNNEQGQLLRLFLPELAAINDHAQRTVLINLLYKKGVMSQGKALPEIKDKNLSAIALDLHKRFMCSKQMQDLGFSNDIIAFAGKKDGLDAARFRHVIFNVEEKCKGVHERLRKSSTDTDKVGQWQKADDEYRRSLYSIAYDGITQSTIDLSFKINQAEAKILNIVDPEIQSWLQKILVVIANVVITAITVGIANDIKERQTGNYWFFNQTTSGEELRALDKDVKTLIDCPDAEFVQLTLN
ncbi:hypothetical protein [uncultured Legionella sp.]|uniref:hypothetical protein n=1 Tax=uncultured Legionella sp. TaxID=210934 RepID=UPI00260F6C72|nr:hypothetical protein [uncultured Legionella sp.]